MWGGWEGSECVGRRKRGGYIPTFLPPQQLPINIHLSPHIHLSITTLTSLLLHTLTSLSPHSPLSLSTLTSLPLHTHLSPSPHSPLSLSTLTSLPLHTHLSPSPHSPLDLPLHTPSPHSPLSLSTLTSLPLHTHLSPSPHSPLSLSTLTSLPLHTHLSPITPTSPPSCEWVPGISWGANHGSFSLNSSGPGGTSGAHTTYCEKVADPPVSS